MNYENTLIYKLCCKDVTITDVYVGHTTNFKARKNQHNSSCNNEKQKSHSLRVYKFIRENGGWENWEMILVEAFSCNNRLEAERKKALLYGNIKRFIKFKCAVKNYSRIQRATQRQKERI